MRTSWSMTLFVVTVLLAVGLPSVALELHSVDFPERRSVNVTMEPATGAPAATMTAEVTYRNGNARIQLDYQKMKPAILYGGDVTSYVLWAIGRDGHTENLGELLARDSSDRQYFDSGQKNFALLVTAESFYLKSRPGKIVVLESKPVRDNRNPSKPFAFDGFEATPAHDTKSITNAKPTSKTSLYMAQARKLYELAGRNQAGTHASQIHAEATSAIKTANKLEGDSMKSREMRDAARRAVALSNEAITISLHRIEALEIERRLAERRAEALRMEQLAAEAERAAEQAEQATTRAELETERLRAEKERIVMETVALTRQKADLQSTTERMRREKKAMEADFERDKASLERESDRLRREKAELRARLQSALSHVAETQDSARGLVVNLPDILFDVDQATLKPEAQVVLAKLAGILLITPDHGALIEGHTDATGSAEYNLDLSHRRAESVRAFMHTQGVGGERLEAEGLGMQRPIADNATVGGRKKNRRVEILIRGSETARTEADAAGTSATPASGSRR